MKITRVIFYCLILSLIIFGVDYHIAKAFIHLATLLSIINILLALKNQSLQNISHNKPTLLLVLALLTSASLTLAYYIIFDNKISERHFSNMFYPSLFFSIILPSLKVEKNDKFLLFFTAIISTIIMSFSGIFDYISADNAGFRTSGFLNLPIIYASCMVLMTCWSAAILLKALIKKQWLVVGVSFMAIIAGLTSVLFTGSRGPIMATVVILITLTLYYLVSNSSWAKKLTTIILILGLIALLFSSFPQSKLDNIKIRFQSGIQNVINGFNGEKRKLTSAGIRLDMWEASLVAISDNPLTGIGPGGHVTYFPILEKEKRININTIPIIKFDHMHNDYIQAWLSMGVIFGSLSVMFILYILALFIRKPSNSNRSLSGLAVCSSFILCGLTDVPAHNAASLSLFLIITSLHLSYLQSNNFPSEDNTSHD